MNFFSYGSLQNRRIQFLVCGKFFEGGTKDSLHGYTTEPHNWPEHVPMAKRKDGGVVHGKLYKNLRHADLQRMDHYEGSSYQRHLLPLESGQLANVFIES